MSPPVSAVVICTIRYNFCRIHQTLRVTGRFILFDRPSMRNILTNVFTAPPPLEKQDIMGHLKF
jgi:hypothetical protein